MQVILNAMAVDKVTHEFFFLLAREESRFQSTLFIAILRLSDDSVKQ
jgi:hypothetical protein